MDCLVRRLKNIALFFFSWINFPNFNTLVNVDCLVSCIKILLGFFFLSDSSLLNVNELVTIVHDLILLILIELYTQKFALIDWFSILFSSLVIHLQLQPVYTDINCFVFERHFLNVNELVWPWIYELSSSSNKIIFNFSLK